MADIKKFTGFIAPDGTTHTSLTAATNYTNELKVKEALAVFANVTEESAGVSTADNGDTVIYAGDIPTFLLANRDEILAAFGQKATLRAPRGSKKASAKKATTAPAANPPVPSIEREMAAAGIMDMEE